MFGKTYEIKTYGWDAAKPLATMLINLSHVTLIERQPKTETREYIETLIASGEIKFEDVKNIEGLKANPEDGDYIVIAGLGFKLPCMSKHDGVEELIKAFERKEY